MLKYIYNYQQFLEWYKIKPPTKESQIQHPREMRVNTCSQRFLRFKRELTNLLNQLNVISLTQYLKMFPTCVLAL